MNITPDNIVLVLRYAMEIVELTELKGQDQKHMAIRLIRSVITDSNLEDSKKKICFQMLDANVIERTIDLIIDATKGRLLVNRDEIIDTAQVCCGFFCPKKSS